MAKDISRLIRGMGAATRLIQLLVDEVTRQGGHEEMLYALTVERGRQNLEKIAAFIVSLEWRVPKSVVMKMAFDSCAEEIPDFETIASDEKFFWEPALQKLSIPHVRFIFDDGGIWPIPDELSKQLNGKPLTVAKQVDWAGEPHVLVGYSPSSGLPKVGDIIDVEKIDYIHLSPARYFDLDN